MSSSDPTKAHQVTFNQWRPQFHVISSQGWMNDPCAPLYDASTGTYHVGFQWNPDGCEWGNISWGAATSKDMVHWKVSKVRSIAPSATEDSCGVFTGALSTINLPQHGSEDHLTCFYTSAQRFNIHYTRPYEKGSEVLRAATSLDGGLSWHRYPQSTILPGPPDHLSVTGWRDPYIFRWPRLDDTRGLTPGSTLYGIISGGIRDKTPTIFLYTIDEADPTKWTFLSTLLEPGLNFSSTVLGGDFGVNWEVANIVTLQDQHREEFDVLIVGVEGCKVMEETSVKSSDLVTRAARAGRSQRWLCGKTQQSSTDLVVRMVHTFSGVLDWGMFYAASSFYDSVEDQRVVHGWVLEDDLADSLRAAQGWSGLLALPRSLSMQTIERVDARCISLLETVPGFTCCKDGDGLLKLSTICCQPIPQLQALRCPKAYSHDSLVTLSNLDDKLVSRTPLLLPGLSSWELDSSFSFNKGFDLFGIDIFHSLDHTSLTRILFQPAQSLITIDRAQSCHKDFCSSIRAEPEIAHHAFLSIRDKAANIAKPEDLEIKIFFDVSVLEVFVNSRTVLTTRIYSESGKCFGISPFVVGGEAKGNACIKQFKVWELQPSITFD